MYFCTLYHISGSNCMNLKKKTYIKRKPTNKQKNKKTKTKNKTKPKQIVKQNKNKNKTIKRYNYSDRF